MKHFKQSAREISYAYSAQTFRGRAFIKILENITGRLSLIKRAKGYKNELAGGDDFFNIMFRRYGLSLEILDGAFSTIPKNGPLILIANHPFGILDGLVQYFKMVKHLKDKEKE